MFIKLQNEKLVNSISLLWVTVNRFEKAVEYQLTNGRLVRDKFDTLIEAINAFNEVEREGLLDLDNKYIVNPMYIERIMIDLLYDNQIHYLFSNKKVVVMKYNTAEEAQIAFEDINRTNLIELEGKTGLVSPLFIDGLSIDEVSNRRVSYLLHSGQILKEFFATPEEANDRLVEVAGELESFEYQEIPSDTRELLTLTSAKKTEGGDNTDEYYENEEHFTVEIEGNVINVTETFPFKPFANAIGMKARWYGLLVDLGIERAQVMALDGYSFDSNEVQDAEDEKWGATGDNEFLLWLQGTAGVQNIREIIFADADGEYRPTKITIIFNPYGN